MIDETILAQLKEASELLVKHLPDEGDLSLIVLKGHLLIEKHLYIVVTSALKHPKALDDANLNFHRLALVAKALFYEDHDAYIWDAILELNSLRNALAHRLDVPDLEDRIRRFAQRARAGVVVLGGWPPQTPQVLMASSIAMLCGALTAVIIH